jgi:hypothetical protein
VLKESDLDYLPKSFREVILGAPQWIWERLLKQILNSRVIGFTPYSQ